MVEFIDPKMSVIRESGRLLLQKYNFLGGQHQSRHCRTTLLLLVREQ